MNLAAHCEAILFLKGEPVSNAELARLTGESEEAVREALNELGEKLAGRGVRLVSHERQTALATAPKFAATLKRLAAESLSPEIGRAGLEVLTIIIYRAPAARAEIDYIRGVNSTFTLRALLTRGLIERAQSEKDSRTFVYRPSLSLLHHLGVEKIESVPEYDSVAKKLAIIAQNHERHSE